MRVLGYVKIFDEVYPAKADRIISELLVGPVVDDGGYAAHNLLVSVGQEKLFFAELQGRILRSQGVEFVAFKSRDVVLAVFV